MSHPTVARVPGNERDNVYATLVSAFAHDPVERWI